MCSALGALRLGLFLCDVPTPALILDHSTATKWCGLTEAMLDDALNMEPSSLQDVIYTHTAVISGRDQSAGAVGLTTVQGACYENTQVVLANLDCNVDDVGGLQSFVGLGLNNHLTGGYYWGRASGPGAAMPAPGVKLVRSPDEAGRLSLLRVDNSNDGKRSEWCEVCISFFRIPIGHTHTARAQLLRGRRILILGPISVDDSLFPTRPHVLVVVCRTGASFCSGATSCRWCPPRLKHCLLQDPLTCSSAWSALVRAFHPEQNPAYQLFGSVSRRLESGGVPCNTN